MTSEIFYDQDYCYEAMMAELETSSLIVDRICAEYKRAVREIEGIESHDGQWVQSLLRHLDNCAILN